MRSKPLVYNPWYDVRCPMRSAPYMWKRSGRGDVGSNLHFLILLVIIAFTLTATLRISVGSTTGNGIAIIGRATARDRVTANSGRATRSRTSGRSTTTKDRSTTGDSNKTTRSSRDRSAARNKTTTTRRTATERRSTELRATGMSRATVTIGAGRRDATASGRRRATTTGGTSTARTTRESTTSMLETLRLVVNRRRVNEVVATTATVGHAIGAIERQITVDDAEGRVDVGYVLRAETIGVVG